MDISQLVKAIPSDIVDYRQLLSCLREYANPRDKIRTLLASGQVVRIKKGLYVFGDAYRRQPIQRETLANLIYGPSYISLDYALRHYGLIPERVEVVTSVTIAQPRRFETALGMFTYRSLSLNRYRLGFTQGDGERSGYLMASPEKAICDKIWSDKTFMPTSDGDIRSYLKDDLRIDMALLRELDMKSFLAIAAAYESPKVSQTVKWLRKRGGKR